MLQDEFSHLIDFERIQDAVRAVEDDGVSEWAPTYEHPAYQASLGDDDDRQEEPPLEAALAEILRRLRRGEEMRYGTEEELRDRQVSENQPQCQFMTQ